jgi:hypothetical protein
MELMDARNVEDLNADFPNGIGSLDFMKKAEAEHRDALISAAVVEFQRSFAMTCEDIIRLCTYAGRIYGSTILWTLSAHGCIDPKAYPRAVPFTWGIAEYPGLSLSKTQWLGLWENAGFTRDGVPAERPTEPVRLWRAAHPTYKRGFAWTDDIKVAKRFLDMRWHRSRLYECVVPPDRLLAYIHNEGRGESEWIADVKALRLIEHPTKG